MATTCALMMFLMSGAGPRDGNTLESLLKALKDPAAKNRVRAAIDIGNLKPKAHKAVPILFEVASKDQSPEVRQAALGSVALISFIDDKKMPRPLAEIDDKILQRIATFMDDDSIEVRRTAMSCLGVGRAKAKFAIPKLIEAVKHSDSGIRNSALTCLAAIGPDAAPALPVIRMALLDGNEFVRSAAELALHSIKKK